MADVAQIVFYNPYVSARAPRISTSVWISHRQTIEDLYVRQHKTLEAVMKVMATQHGLFAKSVPNPSNGFVEILLYQLMLSSRRQYTEKIRL